MRKIPTTERKPLTIRHVHHPLESTTAFAAVFTTDAPLPDVFRLVVRLRMRSVTPAGNA